MKLVLKKVASRVPWWGKIAIKLALAYLPLDYKVWKRLHLFEHGAMEESTYAYGVFMKHFDAVRSRKVLNGFVGLELGPGDSLLSALVARAYGASAYYLVDSGSFAETDMKRYKAMATFLASRGLPTLEADGMTSTEAILTACCATYGTRGLISLHSIADDSVDFIWSHTVLQHIRQREFLDMMRELRRVVRADGIISHWVDLKDCLGGALNNLRFSDLVWESTFMAGGGFYTNRLRCSEMLGIFKEAGFQADIIDVKRWDELPTPRLKFWGRFRNFLNEDLRIQQFHVILRPV